MKPHRLIRSIFAGWLLALFALAITPKIAIHALVAHHTDAHVRLAHRNADQLNQNGFHCATDNLVVQLPFIAGSLRLQTGVLPCFQLHRTATLEAPLSLLHPVYDLRGPPAFSFCS